MSRPIRKVVIVGGGTAGWMCAAVLSRAFARSLDITLVESDQIGTVGVGEATIPQIRLLTNLLGIDEHEFVRATDATYKLGIQFNGWSTPGSSYMHAFGPIGRSLGLLGFMHYWNRAWHAGLKSSLWDFSLNFQAARAGRFDRLDGPGHSGLAPLVYAFHFDAGLVAHLLRRYSEQRQVRRVEGIVTGTRRNTASGHIESVLLEDGTEVDGELFIDCSGFSGLLIGAELGSSYRDWSHYLPCDRAVAVAGPACQAPRPFTRASAQRAGWQWNIPLQHRTGNGHVYCSDFLSDDEAASILINNLDGPAATEPRLLRFTTGRREAFWKHNCVALGLAAGFMEPLESTSIHLVQSGLARLLELFPDSEFDPELVKEFNDQTAFEYTRIRDFLILHYYANQRAEPFWKQCREMRIPATLHEKIECYLRDGRIRRVGEELFTETGWLQVLHGQLGPPGKHHPLADVVAAPDVMQFLQKTRQAIEKDIEKLGSHGAYLQRHCATKPAD